MPKYVIDFNTEFKHYPKITTVKVLKCQTNYFRK